MHRLFVVDDSPFVRKAIARALANNPGIQVVGEAASGQEALARVPAADPDLVTLDVAMQGMDGLQTLRALLAWRPSLRVIMLSAHTRDGAAAALEALSLGAVDFIDKSSVNLMDLDALARELLERIEAFEPQKAAARPPAPIATDLDLSRVELCVIGASTGGPPAIQQLLEPLPADFPLPIAIVQHMPAGFTGPFAERLNALCRLTVEEAVDGRRLEPGRVLIGPAGRHLRITGRLTTSLSDEPRHPRHIPSVDGLMSSAARARPGAVLAVLLTGMGDDGAEGMVQVKANGGVTIAESEETCVVYGMPRAAALLGGVTQLLPLPQIAALLQGIWGRPRGR